MQSLIAIENMSGFYVSTVPVDGIFGTKLLHDPLLTIGPSVTGVSEVWIKIQKFSIEEMNLKMLSAKY